MVATPASAQLGGTDLIPWPQALPPADVPNDAQAHPVRRCRDGTPRCIARLERRIRKQYRRFDASCDHRAVISYSYLQITRGLRRDLKGPRPGLVRHRRWFAYLTTTFSNRYAEAFRSWRLGLPVPEAWRITLETAADGDYQAGQEVLLFSNAHVQHDLPFAYEEMGIETRAGRSRKPDHDAVNEINARVFDGIEKHIAAHYDPSFSLIDVPFVPVEEIGTLELVKLWRENAWRSAERLLAADSDAERADVVAQIERTSTAWAELISSGSFPGYGATRDEYCRSH
ncbi:MAG: DUF5995 family protein [Solirubrobacterales bacterium]